MPRFALVMALLMALAACSSSPPEPAADHAAATSGDAEKAEKSEKKKAKKSRIIPGLMDPDTLTSMREWADESRRSSRKADEDIYQSKTLKKVGFIVIVII